MTTMKELGQKVSAALLSLRLRLWEWLKACWSALLWLLFYGWRLATECASALLLLTWWLLYPLRWTAYWVWVGFQRGLWRVLLLVCGEFADKGKEATREVITIQVALVAQLALLFGSIASISKPNWEIFELFCFAATLPICSLLSIMGAATMNQSNQMVHYFDSNSVKLARVTLVIGVAIVCFVGWRYINGQLPGQARPSVLTPLRAEPYDFPEGAVVSLADGREVKIDGKGVIVWYSIPPELIRDPLELEAAPQIGGVKVVTAEGNKITKVGQPGESTFFQPVVLREQKDGRCQVFWNQLQGDGNYEIGVVVFDLNKKLSTDELIKKSLKEGALRTQAFTPQR